MFQKLAMSHIDLIFSSNQEHSKFQIKYFLLLIMPTNVRLDHVVDIMELNFSIFCIILKIIVINLLK